MADRDFDPKYGGYFLVMNEFIDKLIHYRLDSNEWSILMLVMRKSWGMQGQAWADLKWLSILEDTELGKSVLSYALRKLKARNILHTRQNGKTTSYKINSKVSTWKEPDEIEPVRKNESVHFSEPNNLVHSIEPKEFTSENQSVHSSEVIPIKDNIKDNSKDTPLPPNGDNGEKKIPSGIELKAENPWLDENAWDDFITHREDKKKPLTPLAITKTINFLEKYQDFQQMIVDQTIINNWTGLFPPRGGMGKAQSLHEQKMAKWKRRYEEKYA